MPNFWPCKFLIVAAYIGKVKAVIDVRLYKLIFMLETEVVACALNRIQSYFAVTCSVVYLYFDSII